MDEVPASPGDDKTMARNPWRPLPGVKPEELASLNAPAASLGETDDLVAASAADSTSPVAAHSPHEDATIPPKQAPLAAEQLLLQSFARPPAAGAALPVRPAAAAAGSGRFSTSTSGSSTAPLISFGDYDLLTELGRGGMGVVYRAWQRSLNRIVAVKMILTGTNASPVEMQRLLAEAQAAAGLDHPGIIPIYQVDQHAGQPFFSMALVEGEDLSTRLRRGPIPSRNAAELTVKIADALAYAHDQGIVHRDLKPGNILVDRKGQPRITDFGLARQLPRTDDSSGQPNAAANPADDVFGTISYMPPEQARGEIDKVGPLSDVYSLGATLYCLLTLRPPFQSANPLDTLMEVISRDPVPLRQLNASVPIDLETICLKCLAKDPRQRYQSAKLLGEDLQRFLNDEPILARRASAVEQLVKWSRRHPGLASSAAVSVLATLTLLLVSLLFNVRLQVAQANMQESLLIAQQLQQMTDQLLVKIATLQQAGVGAGPLRYTEYGGLAAAAAALIPPEGQSPNAATRDRWQQVSDRFTAVDGQESSELSTAISDIDQWLSLNQPSAADRDRLRAHVDQLRQVLSQQWQQEAAAEPELAGQIRSLVVARALGLANRIALAANSDKAAAAREKLEALYRGEFAVTASPELWQQSQTPVAALLNPANLPGSWQLKSAIADWEATASAFAKPSTENSPSKDSAGSASTATATPPAANETSVVNPDGGATGSASPTASSQSSESTAPVDSP